MISTAAVFQLSQGYGLFILLSCWISVLMCLEVAMLRELIALNLLIYTLKTSQKYKSN